MPLVLSVDVFWTGKNLDILERRNKWNIAFTPWYRNDLERLIILRQSLKGFVNESLARYIIDPKEDYFLFKENFSDDKSVIK